MPLYLRDLSKGKFSVLDGFRALGNVELSEYVEYEDIFVRLTGVGTPIIRKLSLVRSARPSDDAWLAMGIAGSKFSNLNRELHFEDNRHFAVYRKLKPGQEVIEPDPYTRRRPAYPLNKYHSTPVPI